MSEALPLGGPVRPRPTLHHVAELAGVSAKTVSRVMNGERYVAAETVTRVRDAARSLDYHPDLNAGSLRRNDRRTGTIGLLVSGVDNPFSGIVHRAVEDVARLHATAVVTSSIEDDPAREREVVSALMRRRVDGLIVMPAASDQAYLEPNLERGMSFVFVDREPAGLAADCVVADNTEGAARATRHLLDHGHRRIAFLGDLSGLQTMQSRRRGYIEELMRADCLVPELIVEGSHDPASARDAVLRLLGLDHPPTAIFSAQNLVTAGAVRALHECGREWDVALISFDDLELGDVLKPGLSTLAQDPYTIGRIAAERLFARLEGDVSPASRIVVPTRFIERGSGEIVPAGN